MRPKHAGARRFHTSGVPKRHSCSESPESLTASLKPKPAWVVELPMAKTTTSNDNERLTRAELEQSNRELRASLQKCEELVSDCKDKLAAAYGLARPPTTKDGAAG